MSMTMKRKGKALLDKSVRYFMDRKVQDGYSSGEAELMAKGFRTGWRTCRNKVLKQGFRDARKLERKKVLLEIFHVLTEVFGENEVGNSYVAFSLGLLSKRLKKFKEDKEQKLKEEKKDETERS